MEFSTEKSVTGVLSVIHTNVKVTDRQTDRDRDKDRQTETER